MTRLAALPAVAGRPALPQISIVTLSLNQGAYLGECLHSVRDQACPGLEHIVVDPGSRDGSRAFLEAQRPSLGGLILEPDQGPADGLNKGFARAQGSIFGYLNADDRLLPGALRRVGEFFRDHPEVDVLCGAIRLIDDAGRPAWRKRTADRFDLQRYLAGVCTVGQQGSFMRRAAFEAIGGFNTANRISWDGELLVDLALAGARFATLDEVLADFRVRADSISAAADAHALRKIENDRMIERAARQGVAPVAPWRREWLRLAYRCDLRRHWRYLAVPLVMPLVETAHASAAAGPVPVAPATAGPCDC